MWKAADPARLGLDAPASIYMAVSVASAVFFTWLVLYGIKALLYHRKVRLRGSVDAAAV